MDPNAFIPAHVPPGLANALNAYFQQPQPQHQPPPQPQLQPQLPQGPPQPPPTEHGAPGVPPNLMHFPSYAFPPQAFGMPMFCPGMHGPVGMHVPGSFSVPGAGGQSQHQQWLTPPFQVGPAPPPAPAPAPVSAPAPAPASPAPVHAQVPPQGTATHTTSTSPGPATIHASQGGPGAFDSQLEVQDHTGPLNQSESQIQQAQSAQSVPAASASVPAGVRSYSDEEKDRMLAEAFKRGKADGLNYKQVLNKLQENEPMNVDWKDYFLENLDRLLPLCTDTPASASQKRKKPAYKKRRGGSSSASRPVASPRAQIQRHGALEDYHGFTHVPVLPDHEKPAPPLRDPPEFNFRFTDGDKIFFIQYLRWRLRAGLVPMKEVLYGELANEIPQHTAEGWKRHWDDHPELPDKIYIAACKREDLEEELKELEESDDDDDDDDNDGDYSGGESPSESSRSGGASRTPRRRPHGWRRVTEDDLRRMARYIVHEKHASWTKHTSWGRWTKFAARPENKMRTVNGWRGVARDHADELDRYVCEHESMQYPNSEAGATKASSDADTLYADDLGADELDDVPVSSLPSLPAAHARSRASASTLSGTGSALEVERVEQKPFDPTPNMEPSAMQKRHIKDEDDHLGAEKPAKRQKHEYEKEEEEEEEEEEAGDVCRVDFSERELKWLEGEVIVVSDSD